MNCNRAADEESRAAIVRRVSRALYCCVDGRARVTNKDGLFGGEKWRPRPGVGEMAED